VSLLAGGARGGGTPGALRGDPLSDVAAEMMSARRTPPVSAPPQ
jgi:hypothetical protein